MSTTLAQAQRRYNLATATESLPRETPILFRIHRSLSEVYKEIPSIHIARASATRQPSMLPSELRFASRPARPLRPAVRISGASATLPSPDRGCGTSCGDATSKVLLFQYGALTFGLVVVGIQCFVARHWLPGFCRVYAVPDTVRLHKSYSYNSQHQSWTAFFSRSNFARLSAALDPSSTCSLPSPSILPSGRAWI